MYMLLNVPATLTKAVLHAVFRKLQSNFTPAVPTFKTQGLDPWNLWVSIQLLKMPMTLAIRCQYHLAQISAIKAIGETAIIAHKILLH